MKIDSLLYRRPVTGGIKDRLRKLAVAAVCLASISAPALANQLRTPAGDARPSVAGERGTLEAALIAAPKVAATDSEAADGQLIVLATAKAFFDKAIDAKTIRFRSVALRRRSFPNGTTYTILCGETNGANRLGGMTGFRPFMVGKFQGRRYDPIVAGEMTELSSNIHDFCYNADPVIIGDWLLKLRTAFDVHTKSAAQNQ